LTDLRSFIAKLNSKFLIKPQLNIELHLKRVATLPGEMLIADNQRNTKNTL